VHGGASTTAAAIVLSFGLHGVCRRFRMRTVTLPLPLFAFVVATRAALGAGVGLLVAERLSPARRRAVGRTLVGIGAATTVPAVRLILRRLNKAQSDAA
jgi:hypothetical protein